MPKSNLRPTLARLVSARLAVAAIATLAAMGLPVTHAGQPGFLTAEQRAADFAAFCRFVEGEYAYFDLKNTQWDRACRFYAPQAEGATDRAAYIQTLERALGELYDPHAHLGTHTPRSHRLVPTQADLFATWRDGKAIISAVRVDSRAANAGLLPGMEVVAIDGVPVEAAAGAIEPKFLSAEDAAARDWALQAALAGRRDRPVMRLSAGMGGNLRQFEYVPGYPEQALLLTSRVIGEVGYVRINNSLGQHALVQAFDDALSRMVGVRSLVLDLRDTPSGGNSAVARGLMGRLVDRMLAYQRHELVSEFRSTGIRRVWDEYVAPRGPAFVEPVVVLVGRWTGSMGEGLAIGLHATRGAPVLGQPMAHLLGAIGETVLPHSNIVVRVPSEKLFHVDGTPRESVVPCAVPVAGGPSTGDAELGSALEVALKLGGLPFDPSRQPACYGLQRP